MGVVIDRIDSSINWGFVFLSIVVFIIVAAIVIPKYKRTLENRNEENINLCLSFGYLVVLSISIGSYFLFSSIK